MSHGHGRGQVAAQVSLAAGTGKSEANTAWCARQPAATVTVKSQWMVKVTFTVGQTSRLSSLSLQRRASAAGGRGAATVSSNDVNHEHDQCQGQAA